jgi:hypothetical protein
MKRNIRRGLKMQAVRPKMEAARGFAETTRRINLSDSVSANTAEARQASRFQNQQSKLSFTSGEFRIPGPQESPSHAELDFDSGRVRRDQES